MTIRTRRSGQVGPWFAVLTNAQVHRVVSDAGHATVALLASGTNGPSVQLRQTTNPAVALGTVPAWETTILDLDPSGTWLLTASTNGGLRQRRWSQGGSEPGRPEVAPGTRFLGARYSSDARHLLTVTPAGSIRVWDSATAQPVGARIEVPGVSVDAIELSPEATRLRVEESGGAVQLYEVRVGSPRLRALLATPAPRAHGPDRGVTICAGWFRHADHGWGIRRPIARRPSAGGSASLAGRSGGSDLGCRDPDPAGRCRAGASGGGIDGCLDALRFLVVVGSPQAPDGTRAFGDGG